MTQKEQVLQYMQKYGSISTIQAFHIGITRLSARIWDLRNDGVQVLSRKVKYKAQNGKWKHYEEYYLGRN